MRIYSYESHLRIQPWKRQNLYIDELIRSRNLFDIQKIHYDLVSANSMDIDPLGNFLLIGLSNGDIDIQCISDPCRGNINQVAYFNMANSNIHRVQWSPNDEQFFTALDNHTLVLVDPNELRPIDKISFDIKLTWSEWNANDTDVIAVCGTESQVRLADLRSGSSTQCLILSAPSKMPNHRATRCLWSKTDIACLIVGDNEGFIHVYDTRHSRVPVAISESDFLPQISGLSFTNDQKYLITSHGTHNRLVQWSFDKCKLVANLDKFRKVKHPEPVSLSPTPSTSQNGSSKRNVQLYDKLNKKVKIQKKTSSQSNSFRHAPSMPDSSYLKCQFHVTDKFIFCPVPFKATKSKELYIYEIDSGQKIKTLKSDEILSNGIYTVQSLFPESLVLYVGGKNRVRVWSIDEDHQRKMEEKMKKFHTDQWDSD